MTEATTKSVPKAFDVLIHLGQTIGSLDMNTSESEAIATAEALWNDAGTRLRQIRADLEAARDKAAANKAKA